jgi:hypothetical protein
MELMALGPGGKGTDSILSLYIMSLIMAGRIGVEGEPTQESITAEFTKDLAEIFAGYDAYKAEEAALVAGPEEVI